MTNPRTFRSDTIDKTVAEKAAAATEKSTTSWLVQRENWMKFSKLIAQACIDEVEKSFVKNAKDDKNYGRTAIDDAKAKIKSVFEL